MPNLLEEVLTCKYRDDLLPLLVTTHAQLRAKVAIAEDPVTLITMIFTILALIISGFAGFNGIAYDRNGTSGSTSQATLLCAALAAEVQASRSRVTMPGAPNATVAESWIQFGGGFALGVWWLVALEYCSSCSQGRGYSAPSQRQLPYQRYCPRLASSIIGIGSPPSSGSQAHTRLAHSGSRGASFGDFARFGACSDAAGGADHTRSSRLLK